MTLLPEKAIYWPAHDALLIADLHLGKVAHFRKAGIAVPTDAGKENFFSLQDLLLTHCPRQVYILGDLFHSDANRDWPLFIELIDHFSAIEFHLIMGNHDILDKSLYAHDRLTTHEELRVGPFVLTHFPLNDRPEDYYLCGHIHPCVRLRGSARQFLRLPCFHFTERGGVLPAYGTFTGMHPIDFGRHSSVYAIADGEVVKIEQ